MLVMLQVDSMMVVTVRVMVAVMVAVLVVNMLMMVMLVMVMLVVIVVVIMDVMMMLVLMVTVIVFEIMNFNGDVIFAMIRDDIVFNFVFHIVVIAMMIIIPFLMIFTVATFETFAVNVTFHMTGAFAKAMAVALTNAFTLSLVTSTSCSLGFRLTACTADFALALTAASTSFFVFILV